MAHPNVERLHKAGLLDTDELDQKTAERIALLSEAEVAALISSAATLGHDEDTDKPRMWIF